MLAPPGRTMSNLMTAHGSSEVPRHSGPTDGNVLRMQLRADMLEVANEQQQRWQEWAMLWERRQGEQLERHLCDVGALAGQVQKLCEELPHTLFLLLSKDSSTQERMGRPPFNRGDLGGAEHIEESGDCGTGGDKAADSGAVALPQKSGPTESNDNLAPNRKYSLNRMDTPMSSFMAERVGSIQTDGDALHVHLRRLQRRQRNRLSDTGKKKLGLKAGARHPRLSGSLVKFVESFPFTATCAFLIILNTIFIGYEVDTSVGRAFEDPPRDLPKWFSYVTMGFTCAFGLELMLRFAAFRLTFITGPECRWNIFDIFVVLCSIAEELLNGIQVSPLRILRALRLVRTLRLVRIIRFFQSLRMIVYCIFNGMMQLAWALVLLFGLITLFSIVCMQGVSTYLLDNSPEESGGGGAATAVGDSSRDLLKGDDMNYPEVRQALYLHYRSIWRASMAMLMSVSGGQDWYDVLQPLAVISHWYLLLFILFVVFVLFGVLNVITGLFVEQALQIRDRELVGQAEMDKIDRFLKDMRDIFTEADTDLSGVITREELDHFLSQDQVLAYMATHQLDVSDLSTMFRLLNQDNTGEIGMEEWLIGCLRLKGAAKTLDMMLLFECMDTFQLQLRNIEAKIGIDAVCHMQKQMGALSGTQQKRGA